MRKSKATRERLWARLGLRSSNAAQPHTNQARAAKLPGHGNRRQNKRRAITEQER